MDEQCSSWKKKIKLKQNYTKGETLIISLKRNGAKTKQNKLREYKKKHPGLNYYSPYYDYSDSDN